MTKEEFLHAIEKEVISYNSIVSSNNGDWIVKGFIDIYKNIYTISIDTKVVSKVIEILLIPEFENFAKKNDLTLLLPPQQNFYPDLSFICNKTNNKFAVDIKSTFKDKKNKIKSMTLGAFTGYFRDRDSSKNTTFPYSQYECHLVLGVIYSRADDSINEKQIYKIDEIEQIQSVIKDFTFFVQPKYKIAGSIPGSGNTKNIGATNNIEKLINGKGDFAELGEEVYDDYWMYYLTSDMAKNASLIRPYTNLKSYLLYKNRGAEILNKHKEEILQSFEDDILGEIDSDEE